MPGIVQVMFTGVIHPSSVIGLATTVSCNMETLSGPPVFTITEVKVLATAADYVTMQ